MGKGSGRGGERESSAKLLSEQLPAGLAKPDALRNLVYRGKITADELKKHRTPEDCWIQIKDKVYDVSGWNEHPGANVIFTMAGEDATDVFAAFHAGASAQFLKEFEIGEIDFAGTHNAALVPDRKQLAFEAAYRKLRAQLVLDGYFTASLAWYGDENAEYQDMGNLDIEGENVSTSVSVSIYLSVYLICRNVCLSVCPSVCLSIYLSIY